MITKNKLQRLKVVYVKTILLSLCIFYTFTTQAQRDSLVADSTKIVLTAEDTKETEKHPKKILIAGTVTVMIGVVVFILYNLRSKD